MRQEPLEDVAELAAEGGLLALQTRDAALLLLRPLPQTLLLAQLQCDAGTHNPDEK